MAESARDASAVAASPTVPAPTTIGAQLREILTLAHAFERRLGSRLSVNPTDLAAMEHLIDSGPLTPSDLATRLGISTAASTLVVDRLVALGHVSRSPHPHDRRKIVVVPSPDSVARAIGELVPVITSVNDVVASLPPAERETVELFLARVADVYRDAVDAP
jgi:DNA-binding MarR family transcriptional regulator